MGEDIMCKTLKSGTVDKSKLDEYVGNSVLLLIEDDLMQLGSCLENFGLPKPNRSAISVQNTQVIQDELYNTSDQKAKSLEKLSCLNSEQQQAHEMILHSVMKNAPGGYGKTFLLETILLSVWSLGKIALAVASSGIAAELLEGGRTAHS